MVSQEPSTELRKIAMKTGLSLETVMSAYTQRRVDLANSNPTKSPEWITQRSVLSTNRVLSEQTGTSTRSKAITYQGILIGVGQLTDQTERLKRKYLSSAGSESEAINQGYLTVDGKVIDRETYNGKPSRTYGEIMEHPRMTRNLYFLAKPKPITESTVTKESFLNGLNPSQVEFSDKLARTVNSGGFKFFIPIEFRATLKKQNGSFQRLGGSSFGQPKKIPIDLTDKDIKRALDQLYLSLDNLEQHTALPSDKKLPIAVLRGIVSEVGTRPSKNSTRMVELSPDEIDSKAEGVTLWVPQDIEIQFGVDSIIHVIGRPYKSKKGATMEPLGIFSPKEDRTSPIEMPQEDISEGEVTVWANV